MLVRRAISLCFVFLILFFLIPPKVIAASITIQNTPSQIGIGDDYTADVNVSISVADGTIYYLRGAFFKEGTSNYCGYTWNEVDWFNGPYSSDWKKLLKITITNHAWSGQLKTKVDANDSGCNTSGTYNFRIERFNDTASDGGGTFNDTQNEQTVTIIIPTPTPTPQPTATNTPVPPTPTTTKIPTATPIPKITSISVNSAHISPTVLLADESKISSKDAVLGTMSASQMDLLTPHPTVTAPPTKIAGKSIAIWPIIFIALGFCLLGTCAILIFFNYKKEGKLW